MAHTRHSLSGRVADGALLAAIVIAPVAGGSAHPHLLPILGGLALIAVLAVLAGITRSHVGLPGLAIGLAIAALVTALQSLPLPPWLLELVSPRAATVRDFVEDGLSLRPISYEPGITGREAAELTILALVAWAAHTRARVHGRPDRVVIAVVIAGLTSALVAVVHRALGADRMLGVLDTARPPATLFTTFVNPNHAAGFMVMASLAAAGLALGSKRRPQLVGWLVAAGALAFVSVLGFSKGGLLAMALGVALLLARAARARATGPVVVISSGVALATAAAVLWRLDGVLRELSGAPADPLGLAAKLGAMKDAWPMILEHPWMGIGRGAYVSAYPAYKTYPYQYTFTHPENVVVQALSDWGIGLGVVALVALVIAIARRFLRSRTLVATGALAGVIAVLAQNFADFSLELLGVSLPVAALLGATGAGVVATLRVPIGGPVHAVSFGAAITALMGGALALAFATPSLEDDLDALAAALRAQPRPAASTLQPVAARHPANAVIAARLSFLAELEAGTSSTTAAHELRRALRWSNRALYLAPTYADAHVGAGRILIRLDHRSQGLGALRQAWTLVSESPRVMDLIGEVVRLSRGPAELVRALPRADARLDLIDGRQLPRLLRKLQLMGRPELGRAVLAELGPALETVPPALLLAIADEARRLGDLEAARALLSRRAAAIPGDGATQLAMVDLAAQAGQLDEAQALLERAIAGGAAEPIAPLHRRAVELALQRHDADRARAALSAFRASMTPTDHHQLVAYQLEARIEERAERLAHALDALDHAVRIAPTHVGTRLERARLALRAGRLREAKRDVDTVLRLDPRHAEATRLAAQLANTEQR